MRIVGPGVYKRQGGDLNDWLVRMFGRFFLVTETRDGRFDVSVEVEGSGGMFTNDTVSADDRMAILDSIQISGRVMR